MAERIPKQTLLPKGSLPPWTKEDPLVRQVTAVTVITCNEHTAHCLRFDGIVAEGETKIVAFAQNYYGFAVAAYVFPGVTIDDWCDKNYRAQLHSEALSVFGLSSKDGS